MEGCFFWFRVSPKKTLFWCVSPLFLCLGYQFFFFSRDFWFRVVFLSPELFLVFFITLERSKRLLLLLLLSKNHHTEESFLLREEFLFCPFSFLEQRFRSNGRQRRERERSFRFVLNIKRRRRRRRIFRRKKEDETNGRK